MKTFKEIASEINKLTYDEHLSRVDFESIYKIVDRELEENPEIVHKEWHRKGRIDALKFCTEFYISD